MDNTYNGWTNRETWLVNVWFNPESSDDLEMIKYQIESDYDNLPDYMREFCDIGSINWDELKSHFEGEENEED